MNRWFKDWSPLPTDMVALLFSPLIVLTIGVFTASIILHVDRAGALGIFLAALAIGILGVLLLFSARLPLYRRGIFLSFGPRLLDARHRRVYWIAYSLVGVSVVLMGLLLVYMNQT